MKADLGPEVPLPLDTETPERQAGLPKACIALNVATSPLPLDSDTKNSEPLLVLRKLPAERGEQTEKEQAMALMVAGDAHKVNRTPWGVLTVCSLRKPAG